MKLITTIALLLFFTEASAAIVNGYIYDESGDPLPYATIYVKETGSGTVTNSEAYYELKLAPGNYEVVFQFIGYKSQVKKLTIGDEPITLNIKLEPEALMLHEVKIKAGKEDPAYSIMRRAIAKAGFHLNQIDSFSAIVYIKGSGQVKDIPFLLRNTLEKEGVDTSKLFLSESVNQIQFKRPNTFSEKVISIRSNGENNNTNPNAYIFTSFYQPEISGAISPLSPKAFAYYKFSYEGTFKDQGVDVSKIKVTPRSRGDDVFDGYLNIVENLWSIHSLELKGVKLGITFSVNQIYNPVKENVWLPVSHNIQFHGSILGFEFEYKYLASVSDYNIFLNPELNFDITVIDNKDQPELAEEVEDEAEDKNLQKLEEIAATKIVSRKQLRKLVKEYEKIEMEQQKEPEVVSTHFFSVDSTAHKSDTSYWQKIRPIPLTSKEVESYVHTDSLAQVEKDEAAGDTIKISKSKKGFQPTDLILGDVYKIGEKSHFEIHSPLKTILFNTVEGWNAEYEISLSRTWGEKNSFIKVSPLVRYAFSREVFNGKTDLQYSFGDYEKRNDLILSGGKYIFQYNNQNPIHPIVNTLTTLFLEQNYMKVYEQDYFNATFRKKINDKSTLSTAVQWANRNELLNHSDSKLINRDVISSYTPNEPVNLEINHTGFPDHEAFTWEANYAYRPWLKYRERNGKKIEIKESSPIFNFKYRGSRPLGNAIIDYDLVEMGFRHTLHNGVRGKLDLVLNAGKFLSKDSMQFMDYKHFNGNLTPIITQDAVGSYRLLDYYLFSTNDQYLNAHANYQFRKFLATQFTFVRMMGLRESVVVNYLAAPTAQNYMEVGYSLDYILRFLRVEAVAAFKDGRYYDFGVRVGVAFGMFTVSN